MPVNIFLLFQKKFKNLLKIKDAYIFCFKRFLSAMIITWSDFYLCLLTRHPNSAFFSENPMKSSKVVFYGYYISISQPFKLSLQACGHYFGELGVKGVLQNRSRKTVHRAGIQACPYESTLHGFDNNLTSRLWLSQGSNQNLFYGFTGGGRIHDFSEGE
ncbi:hypothetical protein [Desulfobotulus alkaliphilus]|uniref:hypothetical protein n=1 Tax=Desulfobotulus alkaliphilus TaxID=622671 RepID=UPI0011AAD554|nr:hypothetical protein [Desulfobotulus alkaliphilus]